MAVPEVTEWFRGSCSDPGCVGGRATVPGWSGNGRWEAGVFDAELAVGSVFAWAARKARRAAGAADDVVNQALDTSVEQVHQLVAERLNGQRSLARVEEEAAAGAAELSQRSRQFLLLAIEDAVGGDAVFAQALEGAVAAVQAVQSAGGTVLASGDGIAVSGNVDIKAGFGGVAALRMGDVTLGNPPAPGPPSQHAALTRLRARLTDELDRQGLTTWELASRARLSHYTVQRVLRSQGLPSRRTVEALVEALSLPRKELLEAWYAVEEIRVSARDSRQGAVRVRQSATAYASVTQSAPLALHVTPRRPVPVRSWLLPSLLAVAFCALLVFTVTPQWSVVLLGAVWAGLIATGVAGALRRPGTAKSPLGRASGGGGRRAAAFQDGITDAALFLQARAAVPPAPPTRDAYLRDAYKRIGPPPGSDTRATGGVR